LLTFKENFVAIGYNKYHYLNDVCADHDYDAESTVPRAQIHNMVPIKRRFRIKAGKASVFGQELYGFFLDPGGNLIGQIDNLDDYYDLNGYVENVRILSIVETVRPSGSTNSVSVYVTEARGVAPFHRIECTPIRDTGPGGTIVSGTGGGTITTAPTIRSFVELASDTDQTINSTQATYLYNQPGYGGMQEMLFTPLQSNSYGPNNPYFFQKCTSQGGVWFDTAYEITAYCYPIATARFEVTDLVSSSNPETVYNDVLGTGLQDGSNCKFSRSKPDPYLSHGVTNPGVAWFKNQKQLHLTIQNWSFDLDDACWDFCKINSMIFRRLDAIESTVSTNSDGTRLAKWVWQNVYYGPLGSHTKKTLPTVIQLIQGDLLEFQKLNSLRLVDAITQNEYFQFWDRDEVSEEFNGDQYCVGMGSIDSQEVNFNNPNSGVQTLISNKYINWSKSHQYNSSYFNTTNKARNFLGCYYNTERRELVIKVTFKAVDHANETNEHDHLWDVFQMGPVCVHRNSFESHEARPFYSSTEQNNGTYLYHECTWRKHFPSQREVNSGLPYTAWGSTTETVFAETAPKPAMAQKALSFGGTLALKDAVGTQLNNEFAGSVYNFWAYEDRCFLSAPILAAQVSGVKGTRTQYYTWNNSNRLCNRDVLVIDTDFSPKAVYSVNGPILGMTITAEGAVGFYSNSQSYPQNWDFKVAKGWNNQGYEKIIEVSGTGNGLAAKRNPLMVIRTAVGRSYHMPEDYSNAAFTAASLGAGITTDSPYVILGYDHSYDQEFTDPGIDHTGGIVRYLREGVDYDIMHSISPIYNTKESINGYFTGRTTYSTVDAYELAGHGARPHYGVGANFISSHTTSNSPAYTAVTTRTYNDYEATKTHTVRMETPAGGTAPWQEATIKETFNMKTRSYQNFETYDKQVRFISSARLGNDNKPYGLEVFNSSGSKRFDVAKRTARIYGIFSGTSSTEITSTTIPGLSSDGSWGVIQTYPSSVFNALIKPGPSTNGTAGAYIDIFKVSGQQTGNSYNNFWTVFNWEVIVFRI
jgi:hypothetical protein